MLQTGSVVLCVKTTLVAERHVLMHETTCCSQKVTCLLAFCMHERYTFCRRVAFVCTKTLFFTEMSCVLYMNAVFVSQKSSACIIGNLLFCRSVAFAMHESASFCRQVVFSCMNTLFSLQKSIYLHEHATLCGM